MTINDSATEKIQVIIADDHAIFLDGLRMLLKTDKDIEIVGEAADGKTLISLAHQLKPDVILTDISMPNTNGIEAIRIIRQVDNNIRCLVLTSFGNDQLIIDALEAGAMGYINKNAGKEEIIEAVKMVYHYHPFYCTTTSSRLARLISKSSFNPYKIQNHSLFSEKEKQIIQLICQEKTSEEIGRLLFMSKRTVEGYRLKIQEKMNVKTTTGIVIYAIKNGLFHLLE